MLVLSRRTGESIVIDHNIEIVVVGVEGDQVRLGIRAPREIDIYRKEIYEVIQEENKKAAAGSVTAEDLKKLFKKN
ncbi:carbon storage regulator CsrA [Paenibacillus soyae]|uniref:Translational regulator CsrA n=1 Tax=Paenibacillus soyae TaxID=2969249 RepID=A0A9X2MVP0_9BACL|nr:carbon storage regulator CsrA [Paenibacillus soyae]MCR2806733.1 carbon storage regulator CsrA [Paenibacillus soyae]